MIVPVSGFGKDGCAETKAPEKTGAVQELRRFRGCIPHLPIVVCQDLARGGTAPGIQIAIKIMITIKSPPSSDFGAARPLAFMRRDPPEAVSATCPVHATVTCDKP